MIPEWSKAMLQNYRTMFKEKHSREWRGNDALLLQIFQDAGSTASSAKEQDEFVLEDMYDLEDK